MKLIIFVALSAYALVVGYLTTYYGDWGALLAAAFSITGWLLFMAGAAEAISEKGAKQ